MLIEQPPAARYGEIEVDGVKYKFRVTKTSGLKTTVVLLNYFTEKYVKEITGVPKKTPIGAMIDIGKNKVLLLRSEIKPPVYWGKALHYSKRK